MTKIVWTDVAAADLANIHAYISKDSSFYARAVVAQILSAVDQLEYFPKSGRIVPEFKKENIREFLTGNYRVIYDLVDAHAKARILTVIHGARLLKH